MFQRFSAAILAASVLSVAAITPVAGADVNNDTSNCELALNPNEKLIVSPASSKNNLVRDPACAAINGSSGAKNQAESTLSTKEGTPNQLGQGLLVGGAIVVVIGIVVAALPVIAPIVKKQFGIDLPVPHIQLPAAPREFRFVVGQ